PLPRARVTCPPRPFGERAFLLAPLAPEAGRGTGGEGAKGIAKRQGRRTLTSCMLVVLLPRGNLQQDAEARVRARVGGVLPRRHVLVQLLLQGRVAQRLQRRVALAPQHREHRLLDPEVVARPLAAVAAQVADVGPADVAAVVDVAGPFLAAAD